MYFFYFYPVGVELERRRPPLLTGLLLGIMAAVFVWSRYFPLLLPLHPYRLIFYPGNQAAWTVVTAIFVHASWFHFLSNMVYLLVFAPSLEDRLGPWRFLHFFLLLGVAGNVVHGLAAMHGWFGCGGTGVAGASGAISGLLALSLVRFYFARLSLAYWVFTPLQGVNRAGRAFLPLPVAVLLWLLLQLVYVVAAREAGSSVSYAAHFGGFGLGLFLAIVLGHHRQARAERRFLQGRRFLDRGQGWAAEGAFLEYLAMVPESLEGRLQLARARRMTGQTGAARLDYRQAFRLASQRGHVAKALEIFQEARRGDSFLGLPAAELAQAAFLMEKQLDFRGAAEAYLDLYRYFPSDERAELALVRAIMLTKSKLGDDVEARRLLETAWRELPMGVWRDFLAEEFNLARRRREDAPPDSWRWRPEPAV
jgi:membrane associated rhomboid family serine protease